MSSNFFTNLVWGATYWHWWILGMVLLGVEVFAPGFFFLWLGIAAGVMGLVLFFDPAISWQLQLILYALMSMGSVLLWWFWLRSGLAHITDQPTLNRRAAQYLNRVFTLTRPITNGRGRIHVDHTWWSVEGEDLPEGTLVRVVGADSMILRVEAVVDTFPPTC